MQYQYWSKKELPQGQEKWQPFKDGTEVMEGSTKPSRKHEGHLMCSDVFWCVAIKTSFPQVWPTCMINSPLWRFPTSLANFVCSLVTSAQTPPSHKEKGLVTSAQTPPSHEEKGLVTIEWFLGCTKSEVLILNKHWLPACMIFHWFMHTLDVALFHWLVQNSRTLTRHNQESLSSHQTLFLVRGWGLETG